MQIVMQRLTSLVMTVVNDNYVFFREFAEGGRRSHVSPVRNTATLLHCIICRPFRYIAESEY